MYSWVIYDDEVGTIYLESSNYCKTKAGALQGAKNAVTDLVKLGRLEPDIDVSIGILSTSRGQIDKLVGPALELGVSSSSENRTWRSFVDGQVVDPLKGLQMASHPEELGRDV